MNIKYFILGIVLLNCCISQSPPDFYTSHGTAIYTNQISDITQDLMEERLDHYVECFSSSGLVSRELVLEALNITIITWETEPFPCQYVEEGKWVKGKCSGVERNGYMKIVWFGGTDGLYHELTHWMMEYNTGIIDYNHDLTEWWDASQKCN